MRRSDREVKDRDGIEEIMRQCLVCHVGMADGGAPYVVPQNFGYRFADDGTLELYFHSALTGKKLDVIRKNNKVCFEMTVEGEQIRADSPCNWGCYYTSVIGYGEAVIIEDAAEKREGLSILFKHQSGLDVEFDDKQAESVCVYKIVSKEFTGKRKQKPGELAEA